MRIGGKELSAADVAWIEKESHQCGSRSELARRLCDRLNLFDNLGRRRTVTARIDLCRLGRSARINLADVTNDAPPRGKDQGPRPHRIKIASRRKGNVDLGSLTTFVVRGRSDPLHQVWKNTLEAHHYLGAGPLCGRQLRYVVKGASGEIVASASFSAAALHVAARDMHIGWSREARRGNRPLLIGQSRFCVTVWQKNLVSRVQSLLLKRIADDWQLSYGIRPVVVETFVDRSRFRGTSYKASNWVHVGKTTGRGRQDHAHDYSETKKSIWLYYLDKDWQRALCLEPIIELDAEADWATREWGAVDLGDRRLTKRLVEYGRSCFQSPTASLPAACGSRAATKGAYRLLSHPNASIETFMSGHRETTLARAQQESVVLAIQDTTSLNYSKHLATEGLGPIGSFGANATLGIHVHALMLTNLESTPLGMLDINAWARKKEGYGDSDARYFLPTGEKESQKWLRGYGEADNAARRLRETKVVVVGDRESDMFEVLEAAEKGTADVLVRAVHERKCLTADNKVEGSVWELVADEQVAGCMSVQVPRRGKRAARKAELEIRFRKVRVRSPHKKGKTRGAQSWAITAVETDTKVRDHINWLLLTSIPIESAEDAAEKVRWYMKRWQIEVYFKTLKSGCRIEDRQSASADCLKAALAIDAVVAWRIMYLVKQGRETPDLPCSVFFEEDEWKALDCYIKKSPKAAKKPPTLRDATRMVASIGGFLGRKCDGEPGPKSIWKGLEKLAVITAVARIFFSSG